MTRSRRTTLVQLAATLGLCAASIVLGPTSTAQTTTEHILLTAPNPLSYERFGSAIASDGQSIVAVSELYDRIVGLGIAAGSVTLFDADTWQVIRQVWASDAAEGDQYGYAVSLDGGVLAVGAPRDSDLGHWSGAAWLVDVATGQELHKLLASDGATGDRLGRSIAISGGRVAVGAPFESDGRGAVYVFDVASGQQLAKLRPTGAVASRGFGWSVALEEDLLLVGAPLEDPDLTPKRGEVYLFDVATMQQLVQLRPAQPQLPQYPFGNFGQDVALEGSLALVGAPWLVAADGTVGCAYVIDLTTQTPLQRLHPEEGLDGDQFGISCALRDGLALVGAIGYDDGFAQYAGAAWVFDAATGAQRAKLVAATPGTASFLGSGTALCNGQAIVGAPDTDLDPPTYNNNCGAAHVYYLEPEGESYCFGDSSGALCPCAAFGSTGAGCANSGGGGATLSASGTASLSGTGFSLAVAGAPGNKPGLLLRGTSAANGGLGNPAGDGLLCVAGQTARSHVQVTSGGAAVFTDARGVPLAAWNQGPGVEVHYQFWYRDALNTCTGLGFNFSNAWAVTWRP